MESVLQECNVKHYPQLFDGLSQAEVLRASHEIMLFTKHLADLELSVWDECDVPRFGWADITSFNLTTEYGGYVYVVQLDVNRGWGTFWIKNRTRI
jgi:hypothetical protein